MWTRVLNGLVAGAAGTVALNITTYADMLIRGREASGVPGEVAATLAGKAGVDLGMGAADSSTEKNRKSGLGALMGFGVGLGVGAAYGLLHPMLRFLPVPLAGIVLGGVAMAASDVPATSLNVTDPAEWGTAGWAADIIPHLAYGFITAMVFDNLRRRML